MNTGSDQGPAGSEAVTTNVNAPRCVKFVVIMWNRPSWYRNVGAYTPSEVHPWVIERSSCDGRSRTLPIWDQSTRLRDRKIGTPGNQVKVDVTR